MFALVANGVVNTIANKPRTGVGGVWLPIEEDPATHSPNQSQTVDGYTIEPDRVIRRWRTLPPPPTREEFDRALARIDQASEVLGGAIEMLADNPETQQAIGAQLSPIRKPVVVEPAPIGGRK